METVKAGIVQEDKSLYASITPNAISGGKIVDFDYFIRLEDDEYEAINGLTDIIEESDTDVDVVIRYALAHGTSILVDKNITWVTNSVPANKIIKGKDRTTVIQSTNVHDNYVTVGSLSMLVNLSVYDKAGQNIVDAGTPHFTVNSPRFTEFYYNATDVPIYPSHYPDTFLVTDIGSSDLQADRSGIGIINWGWGDAFYAGTNGRGVCYRGVANNNDNLGTFLAIPASGCTTGNHFAVYDQYCLTGNLINLYHFGSNFTGTCSNYNMAVGSGSFTGWFTYYSVNNHNRFNVDYLGAINQINVLADLLNTMYSLWIENENYARFRINYDGIRVGDGTNPIDVGLVRTGASTWACYGNFQPYTTDTYANGTFGEHWKEIHSNKYYSSDDTLGVTEDVSISGTVLHFKNGLYVGKN